MKKLYDFSVKSERTLRIVMMEVENESTTVENQEEAPQVQVSCPLLPPKPDIRLKKEKGIKVNFLRIIYALCILGFFVDSKGQTLTQGQVFNAFGQLLGADFSHYSNDLSQPKRVNTEMNTQTNIFKRMADIIREYFGIF